MSSSPLVHWKETISVMDVFSKSTGRFHYWGHCYWIYRHKQLVMNSPRAARAKNQTLSSCGCLTRFAQENNHRCHEEMLLSVDSAVSSTTHADTDGGHPPALYDFSLEQVREWTLRVVIDLGSASAGKIRTTL